MKIVLSEKELQKLQSMKKSGKIDYSVTATTTDSILTWQDGPVVTAMRLGTVLLLDEIDQARTSIMCLNTIAQGKPYYIKKTNELVVPKEGFNLIGTANSKGDGSAMDKFAGTQNMNEAFLDRFYFNIEQDYPSKDVELSILKTHTADNDFANILVKIADQLRISNKKGDIDFRLTTRRLVHIITNYKIIGDKLKAIKYAIARFEPDEQEIIMELYNSLSKPKPKLKPKNELKDPFKDYEEEVTFSDLVGTTARQMAHVSNNIQNNNPPRQKINSDMLIDELEQYMKQYKTNNTKYYYV